MYLIWEQNFHKNRWVILDQKYLRMKKGAKLKQKSCPQKYWYQYFISQVISSWYSLRIFQLGKTRCFPFFFKQNFTKSLLQPIMYINIIVYLILDC